MKVKDIDNFHVAAIAQILMGHPSYQPLTEGLDQEKVFTIMCTTISIVVRKLADDDKQFFEAAKKYAGEIKRSYQESLKEEKQESE